MHASRTDLFSHSLISKLWEITEICSASAGRPLADARKQLHANRFFVLFLHHQYVEEDKDKDTSYELMVNRPMEEKTPVDS